MGDYYNKRDKITEQFTLTLKTQLSPICINKILSETAYLASTSSDKILKQKANHMATSFHDLDVSLIRLVFNLSKQTIVEDLNKEL